MTGVMIPGLFKFKFSRSPTPSRRILVLLVVLVVGVILILRVTGSYKLLKPDSTLAGLFDFGAAATGGGCTDDNPVPVPGVVPALGPAVPLPVPVALSPSLPAALGEPLAAASLAVGDSDGT